MCVLTKRILILVTGLLIGGCAKKPEQAKAPPYGSGGIPPQLLAKPDGEAGTAITPGGNAQGPAIEFTPQEDIVFTDPDNPDAGIPELQNLMAAPKKGPWEDSFTIARQTAAREGKPILIWFTSSSNSPMCKALSAELFSKAAFGNWAEKNVVRLRVDSNVTVEDKTLSMDDTANRKTDMKRYVEKLRKRYKVLGYPSLYMLNPSGEVIARYRGYKRGDADYFWGLMKQGVASSNAAYKEWRTKLEGKGYRQWEGRRGKKIFAKLINYSDGNLVLIEPGGERFKTNESNLSKKDRKWIDEQKALRGI